MTPVLPLKKKAPARKPNRLRHPVTISPDPSIIAWFDARIGAHKEFRSRTEAIEQAMYDYIQQSENLASTREVHNLLSKL